MRVQFKEQRLRQGRPGGSKDSPAKAGTPDIWEESLSVPYHTHRSNQPLHSGLTLSRIPDIKGDGGIPSYVRCRTDAVFSSCY